MMQERKQDGKQEKKQNGKRAVRVAVRSEFLQDGETETLLQLVRGCLEEEEGKLRLTYTEREGAAVEITFPKNAPESLRMERGRTVFAFGEGEGRVEVETAIGILQFRFLPLSVRAEEEAGVLKTLRLSYVLENERAGFRREAVVELRLK